MWRMLRRCGRVGDGTEEVRGLPTSYFPGESFIISVMKNVAAWALETAALRGATYADARIVDERQRILSTKTGSVGKA